VFLVFLICSLTSMSPPAMPWRCGFAVYVLTRCLLYVQYWENEARSAQPAADIVKKGGRKNAYKQ
jgi:hypothetical protein